MFEGMTPLWFFPNKGLGTTTVGHRTAPVSVEVIDDHTAKLYLYAENNGYASYTFTTNGSYVASTTASITVNSSNTSKGMVSGTGIYKIGDNALLNATPKDGYHFSRWNDGNTQNPRTVKVTEDKTYTAYFERNSAEVYHNYTIRLNAPFCQGPDGTWFEPAIIGSFNGWSFDWCHDGSACFRLCPESL